MKRRFRITITPDDSVATFARLHLWTSMYWGIDFMKEARFRSQDTKPFFYCAGIEQKLEYYETV